MARKIRGTAFYFGDQVAAKDASLNDFFSWLMAKNAADKKWPYLYSDSRPEKKASVFLKQIDGFLVGIISLDKENKTLHELEDKNGKIELIAKTLVGEIVEMNFFCIRLDNFRGIYSYYVGSYSLQTFLQELWLTYKQFVEQKKAAFENGLEGGLSKTKIEKLLKDYSLHQKKQYQYILMSNDVKSMLNEFCNIEELQVTSFAVHGESDTPVAPNLKQVRSVYRFTVLPIKQDGVLDWALNKYNSSMFTTNNGKNEKHSGYIKGTDMAGLPLFFNFEKNFKDYLEFSYDDLGDIRIDSLETHAIIEKMLKQLRENVIFR